MSALMMAHWWAGSTVEKARLMVVMSDSAKESTTAGQKEYQSADHLEVTKVLRWGAKWETWRELARVATSVGKRVGWLAPQRAD